MSVLAEIPLVVFEPGSTTPAVNATVYITLRGTTTQATVYADEGQAVQRAHPLTTDSQGRIQGWLTRGQYEAQITVAGWPSWSEPFDISPAGDGSVDANWLGTNAVSTGKIADSAVSTAKLANDAVTAAKLGAVIHDPKFGFSSQRSLGTGGVDSSITENNDFLRDGTNRLQIQVTPPVNVVWVVAFRTLIDHDDQSWRRADFALTCSPTPPDGTYRYYVGMGQFHHAGASDWGSLGTIGNFALTAGTTYTAFVRLTWANGLTWRYHRSAEHLYLLGWTFPR